jgi:tetratricopeptide (TPR) repeat protein
MSPRRTVILMGVLLLLLAGYFSLRMIPAGVAPLVSQPGGPPLAGKDAISGLHVRQTVSGAWTADFNYFYTGSPVAAQFVVELTPAPGSPGMFDTFPGNALRGSHRKSVKIQYPGIAGRTAGVTVFMRSPRNGATTVASQHLDKIMDWPDLQTWSVDQQIAAHSPEDNFKQAQALIDSGGDYRIGVAKMTLEKLLEQNPNFDPAYVELARIALRTNWGPEGLHQAEDLLATALQIQPDSTDAKVLLGYVYAHQRHFTKAEALFKEAAATNTSNLWLWANWGEMLELEHRPDPAMAEYRQILSHPMTHDRNDRARTFAYEQLLGLLSQRRNFNAMETLYKQRIAEFGWGSCYSADYARFLLQVRGNINGAIDSARRALNQNCDDAPSRELLGLAEYAKWADSKGPPRTEALNQARIFLPIDARALYLLAASDRTDTAARELVTAGEPIDQKDNYNLDALAYALENKDLDAVRRLMVLGARAETPVGDQGVPVALVPVLNGDVADARLMRRLGVPYSKLRYRGETALDFAKQQGNEAMISALGGGATAL